MEIRVPSMGESIKQVRIAKLLVEEGTWVAENQEVVDLETDKVNQSLYAPQSGVIHWEVSVGDKIEIDALVALLEPASEPEKLTKEIKLQEIKLPPKTENTTSVEEKEIEKGLRVKKDQFINMELVELAHSLQVSSKGLKETRKPMPMIRKVIAEKMVQAQSTSATLSTFNEIDMSAVMALREKYKEPFINKYNVKLGFMSFFVKAAAMALKQVPSLNSFIDGDDIVERHYYDFGVAVSTDRGLVVPVIQNCDQLSFAQIESEIEQMASKARSNQLKLNDLQGGCFTITNGGVFGSLLSTPILNPPQSGILGLHKIEKRAIVGPSDQILVRPMMYVALSYDHRVVDGKDAVTFLVCIKQLIEDPSRLMLEV